METRSLADVDFLTLYRCFVKAFSDYLIPLQPSQDQFREMLQRRGGDLSISAGAFEAAELVGFTINSLGEYSNALTIYDLASGVVPEFRGRRIGEALMEYSVRVGRQQKARQYVLEVFEQNERAVRLYQKIGFQPARKLELFRGRQRKSATGSAPSQFEVRAIEPDWKGFEELWDWHPSWQNSISSVQRSGSPYHTVGVFPKQHPQRCVGYAILFPEIGDIAQICIHRDFRKQGAGTLLLSELQQRMEGEKPLRLVNIDGNSEATIQFLRGQGLDHFGTQFEMKMPL